MLQYNSKNKKEPTVTFDSKESGMMGLIGKSMNPDRFLICCKFKLVKIDFGSLGELEFMEISKSQLEAIIEMHKCMMVNIAREKENE